MNKSMAISCKICAHLFTHEEKQYSLGIFFVCDKCTLPPVNPTCAEWQHDYRPGINSQGETVLCCILCTAILRHQMLSTDVVEYQPEPTWVDC